MTRLVSADGAEVDLEGIRSAREHGEYGFTQFLGPDDDLDARRAVIASELETVRALCEGAIR